MSAVHRKLLPIALLALSLGACGGGEGGGPGGGFTPPPTAVEVSTVSARGIADRFEAVGTVEASEAITVVAEIDGVVRSLPFPEGGRVARGALLARLDDAQLAAELSRAVAVRDQRQASYDRVARVVEQGAGTPQDLDDAAAALAIAKAELALAQARLDKTRITAPFAGVAGARQVDAGAFVRAGQPITTLATLDELRIEFFAPERYLALLEPGAAVSVRTPAFPGEELSGEILVIEPVLDPSTRSARVIARAPNPGERFRPGMSATIVAVLGERPQALTVPSEAVFVQGSENFVFVVAADSTVQRTAVRLGSRTSDAVEVLGGLAAGDRVVRAGHQKLFPGARVAPVESQPGPGEAR